MKCVKYLLFISNLLVVFLGITLIVLGVMTNHKFAQLNPLVEAKDLTVPSTLFIIAGAVIFLIAFLGCCGAMRENHCMMMTYSVLIGLVLIVQLIGAVTAYYREDDVKDTLRKGLNETMFKYSQNTTEGEEIRNAWNFVQKDFKCCGARDFNDWFNVPAWNATAPVPESCCVEETPGCTLGMVQGRNPGVVYDQGCVDKAVDAINIGKLGPVGIVFAVIEVLVVVLACFLAKSIRYSYETV